VGGVRKWESVVQISGVNNCGQVTSGVMDLIADETSETLLVDHKTVVEASGAIHWEHLQYREVMSAPSVTVALNWVRHGSFNQKFF
jgi:hypothetical protein